VNAPGAYAESAIAAFVRRDAQVAIIGLGYVGLPLALTFAEVGVRVLGIDVDRAKVASLLRGESYLEHVAEARIAALRGLLTASVDPAAVRDADAIILALPTPLDPQRDPDLSFVLGTLDAIVPHLRRGQVLSLESTTYPGTTEEEILPRLRDRGFRVGEDYFVVYSPEREDPGNDAYPTRTIPKVIAGATPACLAVGCALYEMAFERLVPVSSTRAAELTKLLENIHRAVNIGLVNELKVLADRMGIDVFEVIDAAATKPFGFTPFYPGPGIGGHCIPVDPFYLTWKARAFGIHTRFIELAGEINRAMPDYVLSKVIDALNDRGRALRGSRILLLGIAYKPNVGDMRQSPAVALMELLRARGAHLSYHDPHVPAFPVMREHHFDLESISLNEAALADCDAVLLTTDHDAIDYPLVERCAPLIVDTRGRFRTPNPRVVRA
jgi:UDP-N-acetyl-D-glucosamine dehydrogenase